MGSTIGDEVMKMYKKELSANSAKKPGFGSGMRLFIIVNIGLLLVVLVTLGIVHYFNTFITLQQSIYKNGSGIEVEYQRRSNLVPGLTDIAKEYAEYERDLTMFIADIRTIKMISQKTEINALLQRNPEVEKALTKLVALAEQYPELRATESYQVLMEKIETTEDRIASTRSAYVLAINAYTTPFQTFPENVFATILGFRKISSYNTEDNPMPLRNERIYFNSKWWDWMWFLRSMWGAHGGQRFEQEIGRDN